uniref:PB1-like domain-containing protein n=1 Tax=Setaria italica TaxID=4555 RepID=K4A0D3_SETIT
MDNLAIRFHFGGDFFSPGGKLNYVGGSTTMSYVEIAKFSLPEITGHLTDHVVGTDVMRLHWLRLGWSFSNGLMFPVDDVSCKAIFDHITYGEVIEIYVDSGTVEKLILEPIKLDSSLLASYPFAFSSAVLSMFSFAKSWLNSLSS